MSDSKTLEIRYVYLILYLYNTGKSNTNETESKNWTAVNGIIAITSLISNQRNNKKNELTG